MKNNISKLKKIMIKRYFKITDYNFFNLIKIKKYEKKIFKL